MREPDTQHRSVALTRAAAAVAVIVLGAVPFFVATTFTGDDHLFLAFARHVPNPLVAFTRDMHGGEFYRPLPMVLWWLLQRTAGGATWPFAACAFALHLAASVEAGLLVRAVSRDRRAALLAASIFFVAPSTRDAAYWYAASTDLLAVTLGLAAVLLSLRGRTLAAAAVLAAACFSKESATVVPVLAVVAHHARDGRAGWKAAVKRGASLVPAVVLVWGCRTAVLRGLGGSGDQAATVTGKLVQLAAGLVQIVPGHDGLGQPGATLAGALGWLVLLVLIFLRVRRSGPSAFPLAALLWTALAVLPLLAAPWIVGARYFYLATVGVAWMWGRTLSATTPIFAVVFLALLSGLSYGAAASRRADVRSYEARASAARRAVVAGLAEGHRTFHVASGIKDIDLVVKEDPRCSAPGGEDLVVLGDVPASFVLLPASGSSRVDFLLARPPLPPAGAYHFGERRVVALARRGDDPTLDEVLDRLPDLRFIRLRLGPGGRVVYRDVTDMVRALPALDEED